MTVSDVLKSDIESYASSLRASNDLLRQAGRGEISGATIAAYLSNVHFLICHTDPNLELARQRAQELGHDRLADYFARKAIEERGHHVWAERDMERLRGLLGVDGAVERSRSIEELLVYLRRAIVEDPTQYLAYILFTEYLTVLVGPEWLAMLEERCGIPATTMTVVGNHVTLDQDHVSEGLHEIDELVPEANQLAPLRQALRESMRYFDGFWNELSQMRVTH